MKLCKLFLKNMALNWLKSSEISIGLLTVWRVTTDWQLMAEFFCFDFGKGAKIQNEKVEKIK